MYQMVIKYPKCPQNSPKVHKIYVSIVSNLPSKIYPYWDFWLENKPNLATQPG
jgi:hypothetical protein